MIRARICFAALAVIRDAETNVISAFNILEGVVPQGFPAFLQHSSFFVLWERDADDPDETRGEFRVEIGGNRLSTAQVTVNFQGGRTNRTIVNLNGLAVPQPGELQFSVVLQTGALAEYIVRVDAPPVVARPVV